MRPFKGTPGVREKLVGVASEGQPAFALCDGYYCDRSESTEDRALRGYAREGWENPVEKNGAGEV